MSINQENPTPRILIVEDEVIIAHELRASLENLGYKICGMEMSAENGIALCKKDPPDLVLSDITLKGRMDGIEAAEIIRSRWGIPVVFLTADADLERLKKAHLVYPFGYLIKPFREQDLKLTLEMALYVSKVDAERKKAEEALRSSEEKLSRIFKTIPDPVSIIRLSDGIFLDVNETFIRVTGYPKEEIVGRPYYSGNPDIWIHRKDRVRVVTALRETGEVHGVEAIFRGKDGNVIYGLISARTLEINGESCILGIVSDITERRRQEGALRESEKKLKLAQAIGKIGNWSWNIDPDRAEWSDQVYEIFKAPRKEGSYQFVKSFVHPDDLDLWQETIREAIKRKESFSLDFRAIRPDGETIWVHDMTRTVFNEQGELIGYEGTVQDITERKRMEEMLQKTRQQLKLIFDTVPALIWQKDREEKYVAVNKAFCHTFGIPEEDILGKTDHDLFPPEIAEQFVRDDRRILNTGVPEFGLEEHYQKASGEGGWNRTDKMVYFDDGGNVAGTIGFALDITERKKAEEDLLKSRKRLRALSAHIQSVREEERANMSREIHDDLGQQLTGLKLGLGWLLGQLKPDQSNLKDKAQAMGQLIDQTVWTVRRISTELHPRILDDFGLVAALEWQAQEFTKKTGITCLFRSIGRQLDQKPDLSIAVFRIFQETLTNVVRHSRATKVEASLKKDAKGLVLMIRDNGRGISDEEIAQSNSLGLVGMRERALIFGGTVEIKGIKGKGTTVILRLPITK